MPETPLQPLRYPKAVLLDWDNTLVDTWPTIRDAMNHTLAHFGMEPWSMDETRTRVRKSMRDSFPALFGESWQDAADVFYGRYQAIHLERLTPLDGAEDLLRYLHQTGIFTAIVSNKVGNCLRTEAAHLGWDACLENTIGAGDAERDKPAIDPVMLALHGSTREPGGDVWFVGDANIDLDCGTQAGCVPVLVRENPPDENEMATLPPHHYVKNCNQLKGIIEGLQP